MIDKKGDINLVSDNDTAYSYSDPSYVSDERGRVQMALTYASNHSGYFNDNKMYGEYLLAGKENEDYYNRNLNFGKLDPDAQVLGAGKGIADSVVEQIKGLYGLGEGLVTNPEGTTTGVLHELIKSASNPQDVVKAFLQAEQNADIQARLFRLQGEPGKAAEVEAKWATDFVSTFVAVNGAGKLGQVAESLMKRVSAARVAAEGSSGAKGAGAGKAPYSSTVSTDAEAGIAYNHPVKEVGAKGTEVASTGPKVPPKLQPFTNPPQGPVIPSGWVSRPGRSSGSTIYYPPGTDPSAPGSTYIRLMPSGSTPVPGLENGYWISVRNGQPINPATGGTGTRGDTHVPLPPDTVPPKR
ncbi:hypothetical protein I5P85_28450 [Pseudomonas putida]|nr:hypothetical protein [Pseudomonas putida]MBH3414718.1 hypothetical protein [Pseudomonas putida]